MSWDAATYDAAHGFVTNYGNEVLGLLEPRPGERILDIGCGTGHHAEMMVAAGAEVVGIDLDREMLAKARNDHPEITFIEADATTWRSGKPFDAAFSNAALHWMLDLPGVFACTRDNVKPGGRLVFEMGGRGNVERTSGSLLQAIQDVTRVKAENPKNYLSIGDVAPMLEASGFLVEAAWLFPRPTPLQGEDGLLNWYRQFGFRMLSQIPENRREEVMSRAVELAKPFLWDGNLWLADYVRLRVKARRV